jgi:hypothetical protein
LERHEADEALRHVFDRAFRGDAVELYDQPRLLACQVECIEFAATVATENEPPRVEVLEQLDPSPASSRSQCTTDSDRLPSSFNMPFQPAREG